MGAAIQDVTDAYEYNSVEKYPGYGVRQEFHCMPFVKVRISNIVSRPSEGLFVFVCLSTPCLTHMFFLPFLAMSK